MYEKLDIGSEVIARGRLAPIASSARRLTPEQRDRTREFLNSLYRDFVDRVATGRGLAPEQVDKLGRGRVWLGETARENGLVDENGGLHAAVVRAKREAGIDPELDPERVIFPGPRSVAEQVEDLVRGDLAAALLQGWLPPRLPEVAAAWLDGLDGDVAYLPPYWIEIR